MSQAFDKIKVASAKVTENGNILVNVTNKVNEIGIKGKLMSSFSGNFSLDEVKKKLVPNILIINVPSDMIDETPTTKICEKDVFLNKKITVTLLFQ